MSWQALQISVAANEVARTEALLQLAGAVAISLAGEGEAALFEPAPGETPLWSSVRLTALFPPAVALGPTADALRAALGPGGAITVRALGEQDWHGAAQQRPATRRFGARLVVAAADTELRAPAPVVVRLSPGLGFGTGAHPTTALCLEWLDGELAPGACVVDYGCGSGILAIAALRLGASYAWAVDHEPQALTATRANAALNGVGDRLWSGPPEALPGVQADVVVANILAGTLHALRDVLARCVGPGGRLVLSGLLASQGKALRRHYGHRFGPFTEQRAAGWSLLCAPRRAGQAAPGRCGG